MPYSLQWNMAVEHAFSKSMTLEVAYVGNHAVHVLNDYDANYVLPQNWLAGAFQNRLAADERAAPVRRWELGQAQHTLRTMALPAINSLQALFKYQVQKFQVQAAYTYSHSIGDVQLDDSSAGLGWHSYMWGANPSLNRGNTQINRPQIFVANLVYYLPDLKDQNEVVQAIAGGWELGAITQYASGTSTTFSQNGIERRHCEDHRQCQWRPTSLFGSGYTNSQRPLSTGAGCQLVRAGRRC